MVIKLYYYYLALYREWLPTEKKNELMEGVQEFDYTGYSETAKTSHLRFLELLSNYRSPENKITNGNIPESVWNLVDNCSKELSILNAEVGSGDKLYREASEEIVRFSTRLITLWAKENSSLAGIEIQGMTLGRTLMDVCVATMDKIGEIETEEATAQWFNDAYINLLALKEVVAPEGGCYIATMAYGDYDHPQVLILRDFRDSYLSKSMIGRQFIAFYYRVSPTLVELFGGYARVNKLSQKLLDLLIAYIIPK